MPGTQHDDTTIESPVDELVEESSIEEQIEEESTEEVNEEQSNDESGEESDESGEEQLVISMDGEEITQEEEEHARAPEWVRDLRKANREKDKKIRELEAKLNTGVSQPAKPAALPPKPKLEDVDFDPDAYEEKLTEWFDQKKRHDAQVEAAQRAQEEANRAWQEKYASYTKAKTELKVRDFEDAEAYVQERFNVTQQGILVQGLENPALVVYALGKNKKKAEELSKITDPVRFAVVVGKLETQLKVTTRKSPPPPPKTVSGTARVSGAVDSTLDRLRAEAEKTGDYTKVLRYKQQKKKAG